MNENQNNGKSMTENQRKYVEGLLMDKRISEKYEDYKQYVNTILNSKYKLSCQHASNIIDNLKNIIDFNETLKKCSNGNGNSNSNEEIVSEQIK